MWTSRSSGRAVRGGGAHDGAHGARDAGRVGGERQHPELKKLFGHHADETREHIRRIEESFRHLGEEVDDSPCPAIEGLAKEAQATIKKAQGRVVESVIVSAAAETEHHEIAVYESLITMAEAHSHADVARLLRESLEQEKHTLQEVQASGERIASESTLAA